MSRRPFKGMINVDVRDSMPDWDPYMPPRAPEGAPNVLIVLYDDTGLAAWSPFGGRINMPTLERLADDGLTLLAVAHHRALLADALVLADRAQPPPERVGAASPKASTGFPGLQRPHPAGERDHGRGAARQRLEHLLGRQEPQRAVDESTLGAPKTQLAAAPGLRPLLRLHRRRDQPVVSRRWSRTTTSSTSPTRPRTATTSPRTSPTRRCRCIRDSKPVRARQALVHVVLPGRQPRPAPRSDRSTSTSTRAQFDDGYEAYREWVLPRMIEKGILPEGTELTPINPMPEGTSQPGRRRAPVGRAQRRTRRSCSPRMAEVYAGFSEYTDAQVGRIVDYLEESGQLDNTIIFYCADNGASGEGSPNGSVNENKFFNGWPDEHRGEPGAASTSSAARTPTTTTRPAGRWPSPRRSRCSSATRTRAASCDPLVIHWPAGHQGQGRGAPPVPPRHRHRADDPRLLRPRVPRAASTASTRCRCPGVSMRYSFDAADAPTHEADASTTRCSAPAASGTRAGRRSPCTGRRPASGTSTTTSGSCSTPTWTASEAHDLAAEHPEKLKELIELWFEEAGQVRRAAARRPPRRSRSSTTCAPQAEPDRDTYIYYPGTAEVPEAAAANIRGALVQDPRRGRDRRAADAEGVIFAHGSRFGGHALFLKDGRLYYVYNFLGIPPEQQLLLRRAGTGPLRARRWSSPRRASASTARRTGTTRLYIDDNAVAEGTMRTQLGYFTLCGDGLCVGRDSERRGQPARTEVAGVLTGGDDHAGRGQRRRRPVPRPREGGDGGPRPRIAAMTFDG